MRTAPRIVFSQQGRKVAIEQTYFACIADRKKMKNLFCCFRMDKTTLIMDSNFKKDALDLEHLVFCKFIISKKMFAHVISRSRSSKIFITNEIIGNLGNTIFNIIYNC